MTKEIVTEIVIVMGFNAGGKTTIVEEFVADGYHRLNRDEMGGSLDSQAKAAREAICEGHKVVLDNTYLTVDSRESIIAVGEEHNVPVRCVHLTTSFEDAQLNACLRMVQRTGRLLMPEDFKGEFKNDPNMFPPAALYAARKRFQPPKENEGFSTVEKREFVRTWPSNYTNKAIFLDYDNTLRHNTGNELWPEDPSEVQLLPRRTEKLEQCIRDEFILLGASNQSAIAKAGKPRGITNETAVACYERTNELLGLKIDYMFCPHQVPPITCYCRKPGSGIGAYFIVKYKLDPHRCIMVGDQTSDLTFAQRCGFKYEDEKDFFK